ncbi:alpha/beta fold hydrolase [Salipiger abyssi]|uniref:Putative hydrolase or acyltransferase of alpha/beta superfamily n=1 Tax=Salipiger abyssi TaxID=1250539 RepID=A0A1P8URQ0_9RHOB|nr:alpha/beta fold hydrolase [Salipiger abyssi]APZ52080.1 putative hydrolase or acyltransferase of alpha/beta superfamily [Salipiger abyssi]
MARFLLVHGSSHGAWCWRDVLPALAARGHEATAIDLPGHGADDTPPEGITLGSYVQAILEALPEPAILVGHSMAGVPITQTAEEAPERVRRLVYLCAYRPGGTGDSVATLRRRQSEQPLLPAIRRDPGRASFHFAPDMSRDLFYHDCSDAAVEFAMANLCSQAIPPQAEGVRLAGRAETVPQSYIVCGEDHAIPPAYQREMAAALPPEDVYERPWSHSPFLSDPEGLAALLDRIAQG